MTTIKGNDDPATVLDRISQKTAMAAEITKDILKRTKCDPADLMVLLENPNGSAGLDEEYAKFIYRFGECNGRDVASLYICNGFFQSVHNGSIVVRPDSGPWSTMSFGGSVSIGGSYIYEPNKYQVFLSTIINDICNREDAKKSAQEELDRRAAVILFRQLAEDLVEDLRRNSKSKNPVVEPEPALESKSNPMLTQSQIEAIVKAGGFPIPDDEEVLLVNLHGGMYSTRKGDLSPKRSSLWYTRPHDRSMQMNDTAYFDPPTEIFNIPDEKIIAVFPTPDGNGPVYIAAPRGCEFWYRKTTFVHGDKKIPNLWLAICDGPRYGHDFTTPTRSAICLAIESANNGSKNCSGPIR